MTTILYFFWNGFSGAATIAGPYHCVAVASHQPGLVAVAIHQVGAQATASV